MRKLRIFDDHLWLRYVLAVIVGLLMALAVCLYKGVFRETDPALIIRYLSDACLMPGVLLTGIGLLSFLKKEGTYDGLTYSFHSMRMASARRFSDEAHDDMARTYYDYKQSVKAKRKVAWHLIIVGGVFLLAAIVLTIVFLKAF